MRRKFKASYFVIPLVYAALIFFLIILQFTGGRLFSANIGPISLSGAFQMGGSADSKQVSSIKMQVQGIQFLFDADHKLQIQNQDDSFVETALEGYETVDNGFELNFHYGVRLGFQYNDSDKNTVLINLDIPQSLSPLKSVRLPYASVGDSTLTPSQGVPGLEVAFRGTTYFLSLPPRSFIDSEKSRIVVPGDGSKSFRIAQKSSGGQNVFEEFQVPTISQKDYSDAVTSFINTAYNGWKSTRYNSSSGTWAFREGDNKFSEEIMVDLLAEAWQRDEYTRVFNEMRTSADEHPTEIGYRSSVFLGHLRRVTTALDDADRRESDRLAGLISARNLDLYLSPDLFQFSTDRGNSGLSTALVQFTDSIGLDSIDAVHALGILRNYYLAKLPDPKLENSLSRFSALIKQVVIPAIVHVDEGYFFQTQAGKADGYDTVLAGCILEKAGVKLADDKLVALGRNMVLSVLRLGDDLGYIPSEIDFSAGAISAMVKYLGPESVYSLIQDNPAYPKYVSLYPQLGAGAWLYTVATVNTIDIKPDQYRFNISYPASRTHYIIFRGLPKIDPLSGMQLFGITWRNAPDFEDYSKGRYYNPDDRTLMIKYFDDSVQRDIIIWYK